MNKNLMLFQQLGPEKFSAAVSTVAPYFGSIDPEFIALRPGHAEVRMWLIPLSQGAPDVVCGAA